MSAGGWRLRIHERGQPPAREVEAREGLTIGRNPDNACVLADEHVGRFQLKVVDVAGALCFEELGASNPSRLGERPLARGERVPFAPRLHLRVGQSILELVAPAGAEDPDRTLAPRAGDEHTLVAPGAPRSDPELTRVGCLAVDEQATLVGRSAAPAAPPAASSAQAPAPAASAAASPPPPPPPPPAPPVEVPTPSRPAPIPLVQPGERPEDLEGEVGGSTLQLGGRDLADGIAARAFLETRRARLVLAGEVDRRSVAIESAELLIGREVGECRLAHPAVSARHARIRANAALGTFQVEDLSSGNHTYLNGATLSPGVAQTLLPESHLRFGTIDALFVVELDAESQPVPAAAYRRAVELLVAQGTLRKEQAAEALARAHRDGQHPGEALILAGALRVGSWRSAFEAARLAPLAGGSGLSGKRLKWVLLGAAVLVILGLLLSIL